ncbi:phosphoglycerate dehydrogenase [Caldisalinibacter kiritimatiensis]|uniref:D-3-phosphoglycerate dehydrogenase n=1 Tax=Caldisalinibacter kiritimatiensis TaxID=1304284 RepID=R1CS85_9FIRM|nr:phosphoglycerate dehydrogenase [Caldisalinibacter kiritimatiensis]EOD01506.1 D-3-phosphoglycerate dehydrogenase [Caldisalinibacter kiritimatiensis]
MNKIKKLGYKLIYIHEKEITNCESIKDIDILVCYNPFNNLDISKLKNLKWIQLSSIGIDQAPIKHIKENDIILTNNKGGYSIPIGEWVVLKILELAKNSNKFYKKQQKKKWKLDTSVLEIFGKTIGFIGTGSIAKESAKRLQGFDAKLIGLNTSGRDVEYFDKCYGVNDFKYMVSLCDIIVVSIPYTSKTHHLLNEEIFKEMKNNVYIINVARGNIINERHLIKYLKNGKIKGAALDVFENEPLSPDSPLWELDNVIITPHNSWVSEMRNERRFNLIYENMKRYINGEKLLNVVNLEKGY